MKPLDPEPPRIARTWYAVARCASCSWSASLSGDSELEVAVFLHDLLIAHNDIHRDRPARVQ